jgi:ankyrin repeat protein
VSGIADLLGAIRRGDATTVGALLAAGPDLASARDERGNSPPLIATYSGKHDIVRLLRERGARPSFFEACALGLVDDVRRQLAENPGLVGQWSHDGWPPLHLAAFFGHRETAESLLDAGADVRAIARNSEANLAINAAAAGPRTDRRPEIVRLLIARGSPVDGRGSPAGHTPLHEAALNGDLALVRLLLDSGADRTVRTGDGDTARGIAVKHGRAEVVHLLGG